MITLLIAPAGGGKTYWLARHNLPTIDLTVTTHRAMLIALCDLVGLDIPKRATIADLLALLVDFPSPRAVAMDNIDRVGRKALYSLLALSAAGWDITATATERRKLAILLERQAAQIVDYQPPALTDVIRGVWPDAPAVQIARIRAIARTPAAAAHLARRARDGQPIDAPPVARSAYPLLTIAAIVGLALWKQAHAANLDYAEITALTLALYWLRRRFYLKG